MNEQEQFWRGEFGDEYSRRQKDSRVGSVESNMALFAGILGKTQGVTRIIELGAGTGQNLMAIARLKPDIELMGVEINEQAAMEIPVGYVFRQSIFDFDPPNYEHADLAFTKGLLIHIAPEDLAKAYDALFACTQRYVLICEYYNPVPVELDYRGHAGRLWKRDFGGDMLARFPGLQLVDYGFVWRSDPNWPQDDITWWLMEKVA